MAAGQDLAALTAEVAQLAEAVRGMAQREIAVKTMPWPRSCGPVRRAS